MYVLLALLVSSMFAEYIQTRDSQNFLSYINVYVHENECVLYGLLNAQNKQSDLVALEALPCVVIHTYTYEYVCVCVYGKQDTLPYRTYHQSIIGLVAAYAFDV